MKPDIAKKLVEPFDRKKLKKTPQNLDYIPIAEVVARMNEAVGVGRWRVQILDTQSWGSRDTLQGPAPTHIIATVRVHVFDDEVGEWTWCDGMGGQDVGFFNSEHDKWAKYGRKGPEPTGRERTVSPGPLNLGDNYKGACSDATKKALQHLGVGLELARDGVGVEVTEPVIDLTAEINEVDEAGAPRFGPAEKDAIKAEWKKRRFDFKLSEVPESRVESIKTFLRSFEGTALSGTKPQEQSDEGAVARSWTKQEITNWLVETFTESGLAEQVARKKVKLLWEKSGYEPNLSINEEERSVLDTMAQRQITDAMKATA